MILPNKVAKALPTVPEDLPPRNPDEYTYFEPVMQRTAFASDPATGTCWTNAWWLADISMLAYCGEPQIQVALGRSGFTMLPGHFISSGTPVLVVGSGAQALVAASEEAIVVAFRGTEVPHISATGLFIFVITIGSAGEDWLTDAAACLALKGPGSIYSAKRT